jgi:ABC-type uncharacterized transport system substrate-binding protein
MTSRRKFTTLLGGAAVWPMVARAQQPRRLRRIGVLMNLSADDAEAQARIGALLQGLQEFGWSIGRNVRIDYRWTAGDPSRLRGYAAELVALSPDIIIANANPSVEVLLQATRDIPIVFMAVTDPVAGGVVGQDPQARLLAVSYPARPGTSSTHGP